jgi:K(+)-stimulated pyrophosphate-energized sodium pump
MTELFVICALCAMGIAFAVNIARWLAGRPIGDDELTRAAGLVSAGALRYLRRQNVVALSVAAVFGAAVLLTFGIAYQARGLQALFPRQHGVISTLAYLVGALVTLACAWIGAWTGRQASVRVAAGARRSLDDALRLGLRAGAITGVVSHAAAVLAVSLCLGALLVYFGGARGEWRVALGHVTRLPLLLAGLALGAAVVSLLAQLGGGIFGRVADVGADVAGKLDALLVEDAATNPATVADLVGDQVGDGASRAASGVATAVTESLAAMMVASIVFVDNPALPSATAWVLFPLVLRAFGLMAGWFGVLVVRTDDTEVPMAAVVRGLYVSGLLYSVAAIGSAKWLLGEHWLRLGGAAVIGVLASLVFLFVAQYYSEQKYGPVRSLAETARSGATLSALRGLLLAADGALVVLAVTMIATVASYHLGSRTGLAHGGMLGIAFAMGGICGVGPYLFAMDAMGTVADNAVGILEMTSGGERPDVDARARLLGSVGTTAKSLARVVTTVAGTLGSFLLMAIFLDQVARARGLRASDLQSPMIYLGGLTGLLVVLAFGRTLLGRIVSAARELVQELRHQLGVAEVEVRAEAQQACVEAVSRAALRGMLPPALVGVGLPLLIGAGLRLLATGDRVTTSAEALVAFVLVATIAGGLGSLLFTKAGSAWDNAKRYIETGAHGGRYIRGRSREALADRAQATTDGEEAVPQEVNPTYVAAVIGDTIGDPLKGAVAPAVQALLATLATLVLVFLPFFL